MLLVDGRRRLVKTVRFGARTYVGDPFNVVRLFSEKEVDEICVLDIDATAEGREPDLGFIRELSSECFMPLSFGGGLTTLSQCEDLNRIGVEKFVLGQSALDLEFVRTLSRHFGAQAVTACVDVSGEGAAARCVTRSSHYDTRRDPTTLCLELEASGVGEIVLQSVDRDGCRSGMDLDLIRHVAGRLRVPLVALGGAGEARHLSEALRAGASAVASGSAFVFIGKLRAVLVTYPDAEEIERIGSAQT